MSRFIELHRSSSSAPVYVKTEWIAYVESIQSSTRIVLGVSRGDGVECIHVSESYELVKSML